MVNSLKISDKKVLVVVPENNNSLYLSARNIRRANVITVSELNTYSILNCNALLIPEATLAAIDSHFNID